ncbi:MAG: heterocyst formation ABC transporter subunit HepA [Pseudanabaenaceae cyanobacterium]|jgi:subfamily B ATP-binding cassette protein MsbA
MDILSVLRFFHPQRLVQNLISDYGFLFREFKSVRKLAIIAFVLSFIAVSFESSNIGLLMVFLQNITNPDIAPLKTGISWFDQSVLAINAAPMERLIRASLLILLSTWLRSIFSYYGLVYTELTNLSLIKRLRHSIFEQIQGLGIHFFGTVKAGDLVNMILGDVNRITQLFQNSSFLITRFLNVIAYLITMFLISWRYTLLAFSLFGLLSVGLSKFNAKIRESSFAIPETNKLFASVTIEVISGIRTIQAFVTQDFERKRYQNAAQDVYLAESKVMRMSTFTKPLAEGISMTILMGMILAASSNVIVGINLPPAALLTFFFVLLRLVPNVQDISSTLSRISSLSGSLQIIRKFLTIEDKYFFQNGNRPFEGLTRGVHFDHVDFGYDPDNLNLHDINLTIRKGQTVALVGASGAGKSTLVDLLARFYNPVSGTIWLDKYPIQEYDIKSLRNKMAIVSQDTFIFNTTVRNNIAYGLSGITDEEIWEAANLANALQFIEEMPEGMDTLLGDRGVRLSGGQRQRLAIARALLRDPQILILDEATSALDSISEQLIQASIEKLAEGKTVVAIAHRLSTIMKADHVVVLEQGRIVEQGRYEDLLKKRGKLWQYHQIQYQDTTLRKLGAKLARQNNPFATKRDEPKEVT